MWAIATYSPQRSAYRPLSSGKSCHWGSGFISPTLRLFGGRVKGSHTGCRVCAIVSMKRVSLTNIAPSFIHKPMEHQTTSLPADPKFNLGLSEKQINLFWKKVKRGVEANDCWEWAAALDNHGYGKFQNNLKSHRISFYLHNGFIPKFDRGTKSIVMHKCDNRKCVNPLHLELGTLADNMVDAKIKGRTPRFGFTGPQLHPERMPRGDRHWSKRFPDKWREMQKRRVLIVTQRISDHAKDPEYVHPNSKLSREQILEIKSRRKNGDSVATLARQFNRSTSAIYNVINNRGSYGKHEELQLA